MKKIKSAILALTLLASMASSVLAVPVGSDVEYIPPTRNLGVGVIDPAAKLEVNGQIMITGGNPQTGYVLTSDSDGLASWQAVSNVNNVDNATTANIADFATSAGTATSATNATNASNISGGTITNSVFLNGVINGSTLQNVTFDDLSFLDPLFQWKLVHVEDFNTTPNGWNLNTITSCGDHSILGGYNVAGVGTVISKILDLTGVPHTHVKVRANFYSIDTYDNEYIILGLDDEHVWSQNFTLNDADRKNICGDANFTDMIVTGEAIKEHTGNTLQIDFKSTLDEAVDNESFGVDNLEVWVRVPLSPPPQLPISGTVPLPQPPQPPQPPATSNWIQANKEECSSFCASIGKTNTPDPDGFRCTAGEARSQTSVQAFNEGRFTFTYGCWSDGNCQGFTTNSSSSSHRKYCYKPGQKRDNDRTDLTVACYCT